MPLLLTEPACVPVAPLAGAAYGAHEAMMPVLTSELFELPHFATLYVVLSQGTLLSAYGLATRLVPAPSSLTIFQKQRNRLFVLPR